MTFSKIVAFLTGSVVAGEALVLLVGMHILSKGPNPWITFKNDLLLAIDILTGLSLVYLVLSKLDFSLSVWFWPLAILILLTHSYREWEYLAHMTNAFCANLPLFVVNTLKLCGIILAIMVGILSKRT
jgi:hypothetical protein